MNTCPKCHRGNALVRYFRGNERGWKCGWSDCCAFISDAEMNGDNSNALILNKMLDLENRIKILESKINV